MYLNSCRGSSPRNPHSWRRQSGERKRSVTNTPNWRERYTGGYIYRKDGITKDCRLVLTYSAATRLWNSKGKLTRSFRHVINVPSLWYYIMIKTSNQYFPAIPGNPRLSINLLVAENGFNRPYNLLTNTWESWKLSKSMIFGRCLLPYENQMWTR